MFMYHYFPVLPFMMLSIVMLIKNIENKIKFKKIYLIYIVIILAVFIYFYPVVSGKVVTSQFVDTLRWFSNWIF